MQVKVTFLMMAYNAEKTIKRAIESILNQSVPDIQLIVRNNGSFDRTGDICNQIAQRDRRVVVLENRNNGITDNGEHIYDLAWWGVDTLVDGEYISIVDADDAIKPDFVEKLYTIASKSRADMTIGGSIFLDESYEILGSRVCQKLTEKEIRDGEFDFPTLYNVMRTWWGKLFEKDFFIKHYKKNWTPMSPLLVPVDTSIMFNYLSDAKVMRFDPDQLYLFTLRKTSTYFLKPITYGRLIEGDAIFESANRFLEKNDIASVDRRVVVAIMHLGYLKESFGDMIESKYDSDYLLRFMEELVNCPSIVKNSELVGSVFIEWIYELVDRLVKRENGSPLLWKSYLIRLRYIEKYELNSKSDIYLANLLSVLLAQKNHTYYIGFDWFVDDKHESIKQFNSYAVARRKWLLNHPEALLQNLVNADETEETTQLRNALSNAWDQQKYEEAADNMQKLSEKSPFDRDAFLARILLSDLIGDMDFCIQLCCIAKELWPSDNEMQYICAEKIVNYKRI